MLNYAKREGYRTYRQGWKEAADYKREPRNVYSVSDRVDIEAIPRELKNAPFRATRIMELGQAKEVANFAKTHNFVSLSDEIIITDERIAHITERHSDVYFKYKNALADLIANPIDIRESRKPNTVEILSKGIGERYVHIILKLADTEGYRASIITMHEMNEEKKQRYLKSGQIEKITIKYNCYEGGKCAAAAYGDDGIGTTSVASGRNAAFSLIEQSFLGCFLIKLLHQLLIQETEKNYIRQRKKR